MVFARKNLRFSGISANEWSCILQYTTSDSGVELIDDELRDILVDSDRWPDHVDLQVSHSTAAVLCFKALLSRGTWGSFETYAAQFWAYHLSQSAITGAGTDEMLLNLYLFYIRGCFCLGSELPCEKAQLLPHITIWVRRAELELCFGVVGGAGSVRIY